MSLYHKDFNEKESEARNYVGLDRWRGMPQSAKNAVIDMVFNLGAGKLETGFHNFTKAIRAGNYAEAAAQSHIIKIGYERNSYNKSQLLAAAYHS